VTNIRRNIGWQNGVLFVNQRTGQLGYSEHRYPKLLPA
jgi:hypothetical protein